jgi:hypothetical protein
MRIPLVIKYPEYRKKGRNRSLTSITDVAGIILRESLLSYDEKQFKDLSGQGNRILTFSLPVSPIIKNIPAKVSFLDTQYHYIYNFIDKEKLRFFQPPPKQTVRGELYNHMQDTEEKNNIYLQHPAIVNAFRKLMKEHLSGLKKIRRINRTIDHRLYIKLKSLGYLAD